jgi:beta-N-acetylhexosaminidase
MRPILFLLFVAITTICVLLIGSNVTWLNLKDHEGLSIKKTQSFDSDSACSPKLSIPNLALSNQKDLARIAGQLIVVGFDGDNPASLGVKQITKHLAEGLISGVLILGRNISSQEKLSRLTRALAQPSIHPPFVMIDQEGGYVQRIRGFPWVNPVPSAEFVATRFSVKQAQALYGKLAAQLSSVGINVNLAPVVDLNVNPSSPVIGKLERAFGSAPSVVTEYAAAFVKAHNEVGILTALKHFPGHGSSTTDPHITANDITGTWGETELIPFRDLIRQRLADMVMTAHVIVRKPPISTRGQVVSMSRNAIKNVLRKSLCFDGVVISDDLAMGAIKAGYSEEQAAVEAIRSGNDIILLAKSDDLVGLGPRINSALVKEAENDPKFKLYLTRAYSRVMLLKQRLQVSRE